MRRWSVLCLGMALTLAAAAIVHVHAGGPPLAPAAPPRDFAPPAVETLLAERVDAERLKQTVRELVSTGPRMGGTPSGDRASALIAAAFTAGGLVPEVIEDPAELAHWEDEWSVALVPGSAVSSAYPNGYSPSVGPIASAYPYGFSPSVGPATAPLVAVGDLGSMSPSSRHDWGGKVLYATAGVLKSYQLIAATGPAAERPLAILTSDPNDGRRYLNAARLQELPPMQPPDAPRPVPVFGVSFQDGRTLAAAAANWAATGSPAAGSAAATAGKPAAAPPLVRISLRSTVRSGRPRTVLASLPGRDRDTYYLICAHGDSDSGGPGADDNASGEAVVLELAQVLAALVRDGRLPPPRATLRFAVWGKEYSSSRAFVAREGARLRRCRGVVNLDEVGTGAERDAIYFESNEVPWNRTLLRTFDRVGADYLGRPGFWPEYTTNPSRGGTDSYAFLPRRYQGELASALQVPATTVYTAAWDQLGRLRQTPGWESRGTPDPIDLQIDYSRYYHSSGDTPANTTERKPQAMARAARAIGIALLRLAF